MEAKRKSGLGIDVSASDIDIAQVQDDKQSEQPKKGVALGVDIGTQFCFAGCVSKDGKEDGKEDCKFISLLPSSGEVAEYGIPTAVAIKVTEGVGPREVEKAYGQEAIDKISDQSWQLINDSLKTLMRRKIDRFQHQYASNRSESLQTSELLQGFVNHLLRFLSYDTLGKNVEINKIVVTYPNVAEDGQEYMNKILSAIKEAVDNLLTDDKFQHKDKFAQDVEKVVVSEAAVAARALEDKVKGSFATIDVGGGTIDIAYTGNMASPHSDDSWAIQKNLDKILKDKGINSSPFALASFKRKGFARDCRDDSSALVKCNECTRSGKCVQINGDEELDICSTITKICTYQKDSNINSSFAYIIRKVIPRAIHEQALQSVVLLGGGSHMIFIQEALKEAFSDLGYNNIQYWTITPTKGDRDRYKVVYEQKGENINEKNITTANFLAYAAALYGESSEEEKERSSMLFTPIASYRPPVSSPPFTYVLAANHPEENETIYYMMPKNFSNGDIYYLYPGLWNLKCEADFSEGVLCTVNLSYGDIKHEQVIINEISLDATRQDDAHIGKVVPFVGPKHIESGVYAVGVRYIGTMEEPSDNNRLQLYLYKSQGEVDGEPCDPKIDATPYIAEVDKSELSASYKADLKFSDFCKAAIKCEKSPT